MKTKYSGTQTEKNLETAFAGESQARNKYTYFASVAKKEGYEQIAALFLQTAENEKEHAKLWLKELEGIGDTAQNLAAAADGENYEWTDMYGRRRGLQGSRSKVPSRGRHRETPRGALPRPAEERGDVSRVREERGEGVGVPQLRTYRCRDKSPETVSDMPASAVILRDTCRELLMPDASGDVDEAFQGRVT